MRDSFIFYRSFYEACRELDAEEFKTTICALSEYALNGKEPQIKGAAKALFTIMKPIIDANNKRYENGKKGGRPKTKQEPNNNQDETNIEPNVNVNVNDNVNVNYKRARERKTKKNSFNQFEQRVYDYNMLEKKLLAR